LVRFSKLLKGIILYYSMGVTDYYLEDICEEQRDLKKVFDKYIFGRGLENPRIFSFCCGVANEGPLLFDRFGENTDITGLDFDESLVPFVSELDRKFVSFGDVRNLDNILIGKYDLVIGRNVPLNPRKGTMDEEFFDYWPGVFTSLMEYMGKDSLLFLTLAREDEFDKACGILRGLELDVEVQEENPIRVHSDFIGIAGANVKDNYVILAQVV